MQVSTRKKNLGFALIEVLIAVTIMSGSMLVVATAANKSLLYARTTLNSYQASLAMEETVEAVKSIRAAGWANIAGLTNGTTYGISWSGSNWQTVSSPQTTALGFTRSIVPSAVYRDANDDIAVSGTLDSGTKKITATVTWNDQGKTKSQTVEFYITNIL